MEKDSQIGNKNPLFLKFINREVGISDILRSFANSPNSHTAEVAVRAMDKVIDLDPFRVELEEAVRDILKEGFGDEFKAFVNNYMEPSLVEEQVVTQGPLGESRVQIATVKDEDQPWVQGFLCYNLCLYLKAFGTDELKACKICSKLFSHKGKFASYCSDTCKKEKKGSEAFKTRL